MMGGWTLALAAVVSAEASPSSAIDPFAQAVAAVSQGYEAEARGNPRQAAAAAEALRAADARPVGSNRDLAVLWGHASTTERNRALGPAYRELTLRGGDAAIFEQTFLGGQRARVAVVPRGHAGVSLRINDKGAERSCANRHGVATCDWVPSFSVRIRIELRNPGKSPASYLIMLQ